MAITRIFETYSISPPDGHPMTTYPPLKLPSESVKCLILTYYNKVCSQKQRYYRGCQKPLLGVY